MHTTIYQIYTNESIFILIPNCIVAENVILKLQKFLNISKAGSVKGVSKAESGPKSLEVLSIPNHCMPV